jgi:putative FmdB family regulatory protein
MPLFEYECLKCGHGFEKLVFRSAGSPDVACPACGSRKVEERFSSFSSRVAGGGSSKRASCAPSGG